MEAAKNRPTGTGSPVGRSPQECHRRGAVGTAPARIGLRMSRFRRSSAGGRTPRHPGGPGLGRSRGARRAGRLRRPGRVPGAAAARLGDRLPGRRRPAGRRVGRRRARPGGGPARPTGRAGHAGPGGAHPPRPFPAAHGRAGTYLGIRRGGALVAMAGERLHPPGWTEISGVCTDESVRGRDWRAGWSWRSRTGSESAARRRSCMRPPPTREPSGFTSPSASGFAGVQNSSPPSSPPCSPRPTGPEAPPARGRSPGPEVPKGTFGTPSGP